MPIRSAQFDNVAEKLECVLHGLPPKLVAIDGRMDAGKTTLGRFLAWYFNSTLLELDLFLIQGGLVHCQDDVARIINRRIDGGKPIFVEGVKVLEVLQTIKKSQDYLIYVRNPAFPRGLGYGKELDEYETIFRPEYIANCVIQSERGIN